MSLELECLSREVACGRISRRIFLSHAAALGFASAAATAMLDRAAMAAGPRRGGILKIGVQGGAATDTLDPALIAGVPAYLGRAWGEHLLYLTPDGQLEPRLATEWHSSPDGKAWVFRIRRGVQFHNGKGLTPDDVVATMRRHSTKESKSGALGIMRGVDSVTRDGDSVIFTLKDSNADFPYLLTDFHLLIQPNGGVDAPNAAIGTGPYRLVVHEPGVRAVGERFKGYWASDKRGWAEQVEFIVLNDNTARMAALQSGAVHMVSRVEPKIVDLLKRSPGITIRNISGRGHYVFAAQCNSSPLDSLDLRLALKFSVDRKEMLDKLLRGFGSIGNDTPINKAYPLYSEIPQRQYDPDKAAFHYKKSGVTEPVVLRTSEVAFPGAVEAAQLFQASCAKAGIKLEVKREPGDGYWTEIWNKKPFAASFWNGRPVQDQMYSTAYITGADWNETRFFNPKFDQMVVAARSELNQERRRQMYRDMAEILSNEGGVIVPMFNDYIDATGPKVGGWVSHPALNLMDLFAASECWLTV